MNHTKHMSQQRSLVQSRIRSSIEVKETVLRDSEFQDLLIHVATRIVESLQHGGKVMFFGNGGSAADAQHLTAEFTGRYLKERKALAALALSTNSSSVTAIGNDYGFDLVFARQLEALGKEGDVAIGISTSGNSPNVIRAFEAAQLRGIYTVAMVGGSGGKMKQVADSAICVPSKETPRIQECHILAGHIICEIVEETMFGEPGEADSGTTDRHMVSGK